MIYKLQIENDKRAQCYGHDSVHTGERILKVPIAQLKTIPGMFYILGFLVKTWYNGCEQERPCPRCKNVGHVLRDCKLEYQPRGNNTYASKASTKPEMMPEREIEVVQEA
ncbi:hypothetical protein ACJMK2_015406 [Sinanodonta woodiana]|uniref:CCHC-type domain-containing protein n=1 Tax=Sinanodonta woodiana TaxID=1069815 RepID=A0ABD3UQ89_SINWO